MAASSFGTLAEALDRKQNDDVLLPGSGNVMTPTSTEFTTLLEQGRRGDRGALAQLAQRYEAKLRLVARVLLGPALRPYLDTVDLVQSVHRSLLVGLRADKFDISSPENLLALALTMVRRKVARHWRHLQRQQRLEARSTEGGDLPGLLASLSSPQSDPASAAQFNDQLRQLCSNLDETEQRMLEMRLQGSSTAEVAQELGLNTVTLRVRLMRLRQRLRAGGVLDDCL